VKIENNESSMPTALEIIEHNAITSLLVGQYEMRYAHWWVFEGSFKQKYNTGLNQIVWELLFKFRLCPARSEVTKWLNSLHFSF